MSFFLGSEPDLAVEMGYLAADRSLDIGEVDVEPWTEYLAGMDPNMDDLEPLLGVPELGAYLGVPAQTIYDWRVT